MKGSSSCVSRQQSRFGTLTIAARLGWYDMLEFCSRPNDQDAEKMWVVLPVKPADPGRLAKELRAIAKRLESE